MRARWLSVARADGGSDVLRVAEGGLVLLIAVALGLTTDAGTQSVLIVIAALSIYAGAYGVLLGYANQPSLGQSLFFGIGAYAVLLPMAHSMWGFWQDILLALAAGGVLGAVVAVLVHRMNQAYHVIVTALFATMAAIGAQSLTSITGGTGGISAAIPPIHFGPITIDAAYVNQSYYLVLGLAAAAFALLYLLVRSPVGLSWKALRENERRAASVGHNVLVLKIVAYSISSALTALAGGLYAMSQQYASSSNFDFEWSVYPFIWVLIGGIGTLMGPVVGVAVFYVFQFYVSQYWANYLILFGLLILVILRWHSEGILGYARRAGNWMLTYLHDRLAGQRSSAGA